MDGGSIWYSRNTHKPDLNLWPAGQREWDCAIEPPYTYRGKEQVWDGEKYISRYAWHAKFRCDRLLLAQNCVFEKRREEDDLPVYCITFPEGWQWFAPMAAGDRPTAKELGSRPYTGPGGDLDGWTGAPYVDWRWMAYKRKGTARNPRQRHADSLFATGSVPAEWNLDGSGLLYRVVFNRPPWRYDEDGDVETDNDGHKIPDESEEESRAYVETHAPDKVIYWRKTDEAHAARVGWGMSGQVWAQDGDGDWWDALRIVPGIAFDLFAYFETFRWVCYEYTGGGEWWERHAQDDKYLNTRATLRARIVQPLPPHGWTPSGGEGGGT